MSEILKGKFYDTDKKHGTNHEYFDYLEKELSDCKHISNIGGVGAMFAFQVFDGTPDVTMKVVHKLFENGVISFIAGKNPTKVRFLFPTPVISKKDLKAVIKITKDTLKNHTK